MTKFIYWRKCTVINMGSSLHSMMNIYLLRDSSVTDSNTTVIKIKTGGKKNTAFPENFGPGSSDRLDRERFSE